MKPPIVLRTDAGTQPQRMSDHVQRILTGFISAVPPQEVIQALAMAMAIVAKGTDDPNKAVNFGINITNGFLKEMLREKSKGKQH